MFEVTIITDFSAAHSLRNYKGKCEDLHGHNWKVEVSAAAAKLDERGIAMDFKTLKAETIRFLDILDHKHLNTISPFDQINPSSENLARYIFEGLSKKINNEWIKIKRVKVWESRDCYATYYE